MQVDADKGYAVKQLYVKRVEPIEGYFLSEYRYEVEKFVLVSGIFFPEVISARYAYQAGDVKITLPFGKERTDLYPQIAGGSTRAC